MIWHNRNFINIKRWTKNDSTRIRLLSSPRALPMIDWLSPIIVNRPIEELVFPVSLHLFLFFVSSYSNGAVCRLLPLTRRLSFVLSMLNSALSCRTFGVVRFHSARTLSSTKRCLRVPIDCCPVTSTSLEHQRTPLRYSLVCGMLPRCTSSWQWQLKCSRTLPCCSSWAELAASDRAVVTNQECCTSSTVRASSRSAQI